MSPDTTDEAQVNKLTIVIVGEGGVGKSSLTLQFIRNEFLESYDPTIDDSYVTTIVVDGVRWQIEVLDTAGQEEYRDLWVEQAITQGEAFIVTYAINSTKSFSAVPGFLKLIANRKSGNSGYRSTSGSPNLKPRDFPFPFVIVGNKVDLISQRSVETSDGAQMAYGSGGLFYECSAKTAMNVENIFFELIRSVVKLREGAASHRKKTKMNNRRFIHNIGYQRSQQATRESSLSLSVLRDQSFSSNQDFLRRMNPDPCDGDPTATMSVDDFNKAPICAEASQDNGVTSTANGTTKSCCTLA